MSRAIVMRAAGTNCDIEMVRAFKKAGAEAHLVHLDEVVRSPDLLDGFDLVGIPGGFSYGDDLGSGRVFSMRLREHVYPALRRAAERGCPMIGICNGFQILVQSGLLPGIGPDETWPVSAPERVAALCVNEGGLYVDRWVEVEAVAESRCVWTQPLVGATDAATGGAVRLPVGHGEGRFVCDAATLARLQAGHQIALRYLDNPNGSTGDVAGICDSSGRIFGLMPHPDRFLEWTRHPSWTRIDGSSRDCQDTPGLAMFRSAVEAARTVAEPTQS